MHRLHSQVGDAVKAMGECGSLTCMYEDQALKGLRRTRSHQRAVGSNGRTPARNLAGAHTAAPGLARSQRRNRGGVSEFEAPHDVIRTTRDTHTTQAEYASIRGIIDWFKDKLRGPEPKAGESGCPGLDLNCDEITREDPRGEKSTEYCNDALVDTPALLRGTCGEMCAIEYANCFGNAIFQGSGAHGESDWNETDRDGGYGDDPAPDGPYTA